MVKYYQDGKFEQKINADYVPEEHPDNTFTPISAHFDLDTREGSQAFFDMLIYKPAPNMNCITEEYIKNQRYRLPSRKEFLHSMLTSKLGLFTIEKTDSKEGYVYLKEVFTGDEYKIVDIALSGDINFKSVYIYTRIITHCHISFNTGLSLIFTKSDGFIEEYIQQQVTENGSYREFLMFTQLYNQYSRFPGNVKIITNQISELS